MTLSNEVKALYDEGRIKTRGMIRFDFGTGTYGYIAAKDALDYGGITYQPFGLIEVSALGGGTGTTADGNFTLKLAESEESGLTPDMLAQIEDEDYRDRPVRIMDAHFHPDTDALIQVETVARGYVDTIEHSFDTKGGSFLIANCEGRQLDYTRKNGRKRTVADQLRRDPGDRFFEHAAFAGRVDVIWGKAGSTALTVARSAGGYIGRAIGFKGI